MKKTLPEPPLESPIPFSHGSNGEYVPRPAGEKASRAEDLFRRTVDERARRLGVSRREFIESAAGTASALLVINQVAGCGANGGGTHPDAGYAVDAAMTWDAEQACEALSGGEFIFDVQTHHVNPSGAWRAANPDWESFFASLPQAGCGETDSIDCFDTQNYLREIFVNSDTSMAVLSSVPADPGENPLEAAEQKATLDLTNRMAGSQRLLTHGLVLPDRGQAQLDGMQKLAETLQIAAWKVYTPYGGWRLDDPVIGIPFIEKARQLGIKIICAHKGFPLAGFDPAFSAPDDIGVVAPMFPDVTFVVYHSAYETRITEGPYDAATPQGIDRLIAACAAHGNVVAELGSTWRNVMTNPTEGAHVLGKLLLHLGPDRIVWGTDSIWYGTPQDQISALRAFQIPAAMQTLYGYPELTAEVKGKIFGLNAAAIYGVDVDATRCAISEDDIALVQRQEHAERRPRRTFRNYGPRTRRELFDFLRLRGGSPG